MSENLPLFIEGEFTQSKSDTHLEVLNPASQEILTKVPFATEEESNRAIASAEKTFQDWQDVPPPERSRLMIAYQNVVNKHHEDIAETLRKENGKNYNAVVSGSLNPDGTALQNEETVFVIKNHPIYKDYDLVYQNVLNLTNKYAGKPTKPTAPANIE